MSKIKLTMSRWILSLILLILPSISMARVKVYLAHSFSGLEKQALEIVKDYFNFTHSDIELILRQEEGETLVSRVKNRRYRCDLFIWAHDIIGSFADRGIITPIEKYITTQDEAKFISTSLRALRYGKGESLYGLPLSLETVILFYNKDIISQPPSTLSELINISKKYTDWQQKKFGLLYPANNYYFNAMFLHSFGGETFDENGNVALNTEAQAKTISFVIKLEDFYKVLPLRVDRYYNGQFVDLFNQGLAAFYITGPWDVGKIKLFRYGVSKLPINDFTSRPLRPFLGVKGIYLLSRARNKKAAIEVMKFITSEKMQFILAFIGGVIPANLSAYNYTEIRDDEIKRVFKEQAIEAEPMPNNSAMAYVWEVMNTKRIGDRDRPSIYERALKNPQSIRFLLRKAQKYCENKIKGR